MSRFRAHGGGLTINRDGSMSAGARSAKSFAVSGQFAPASTKTAVTAGATPAINAALGNFFTLTPAEDETISVTGGVQGQEFVLKVLTSGITSRTLTFGAGFKSTGTLATGTTSGKIFVLKFIHDGTQFCEVSRTAAQ